MEQEQQDLPEGADKTRLHLCLEAMAGLETAERDR